MSAAPVVPPDPFLLFVYGTLMHDGSRRGVLAGQRFVGPARTLPLYQLLDLGAYPGLVRAESGRVVAGELYEVAAALIGRLDEIEGAPHLFRLEAVAVEDVREPVFAYFYQPHPAGVVAYAHERWATPQEAVMTHDEAFLRAIRDEPHDDTPRLVYADWLEEHGQADRGEFIRVQCERALIGEGGAHAATLRAKAERLLERNWEAWVGPLRALVGPDASRRGEAWLADGYHAEGLWRFRRGFVDTLTLGVDAFLDRAASLARLVPLRHLRLWEAGRRPAELANCPLLEGVQVLDFADYFVYPLTADGARGLASSEHLGRLTELHLFGNNLGDRGAEGLAEAHWLGRLELLNLGDNGLSPVGVRALARVEGPLRLAVLHLGGNGVGDTGARELAQSALLASAQRLTLTSTGIGPAGVGALARAPQLSRLHHLDLDHNSLGDPAVARLAESAALGALTHLSLNACDVGDAGAEALAASPHLASLRHLGLNFNRITDRGAAALAASPRLGRLETLALGGNAVSPDWAGALSCSLHLRRIASLSVNPFLGQRR